MSTLTVDAVRPHCGRVKHPVGLADDLCDGRDEPVVGEHLVGVGAREGHLAADGHGVGGL